MQGHETPRDAQLASVLLVDDHAPNLLALEAVLEPLGCRLVRATSGREALARAQEEEFAVALVDVHMPDLDGFETAALLREAAPDAHTAIVFVTAAHRDEAHALRGPATVEVDYVTKPFDADALRAKVRSLVADYRARTATPPSDDVVESAPAPRARVWIADDSRLDTERARRTLADEYDIEVFVDGAAVLERLAQGPPPQVMVLDWHMPSISGDEVCQFVRATYDPLALPILMMTATKASDVGVVEGLRAGANDFVTKPFVPTELRARVESLVRLSELHRRAQQAERALRAQRDFHREANWISETLHRIAVALSTDLDLPTILQRLVDEAAALCRAEAGRFVDFLDATPPGEGSRPEAGAVVSFGEPALSAVLTACSERQVVRIDDAASDARVVQAEAPGRFRSYLGVPVATRSGELLGALVLGHSATGAFTARHERLLAAVAGQAAIAIDNARLFETAQRAHEALRVREAEAVARALFERQLLGIVSHDLRNPLNAILGSVRLLEKRGGLDGPQSYAIARIGASAERATRLVRDLLDFTQTRLGRGIPIQPAPVDLSEVARQVADEIRAAHPGRDIVTSSEGDTHGAWDPDRVAQVVGNLLANAVTYSPRDTPVRLKVEGFAETVSIAVHNAGAPIAPERLAQLFEPLERGTSAENPGRSIGLGLYIVDQIVRAHGGVVQVKSAAAEGTTFTVRLPRLPPTPS